MDEEEPPPYATFRRFACFVPEIGDFGLSWAEFRKMASACGAAAFGGYSIGDIGIMFKQYGINGQHLTYNAFCQLARAVRARSSELTWEIHGIPNDKGIDMPNAGGRHSLLKNKISGCDSDSQPKMPLGGTSGLAVKLRPPCIVREVVPLPCCKHARVLSKLQGLQVMINTAELYLAKTSIPSLYKDWIEAVVESATLKGDDSVNLENAELPVEGQAWFALVRTQVSLAEGRLEEARKHIQAASILITDDFFLDGHQYPHVVALCDGLASFYEFKYAEALDKFEKVKRLASEATGSSLTARRHAATGLNNMGVCLQMLGQHTDAIRSYRSGIASLCSPLAESTEKGDPLVETLMRNMNRALRFQIGSPKVSNPVKENVVPTVKHNQKLFSFLKKAVAGPPKAARTLPPQPSKDPKKESKGKKEAAKKGGKKGGKKKGSKKSSSGGIAKFPTYAPHYGVENIKLPAAKKGKKKK